jgi:hypothetical protein
MSAHDPRSTYQLSKSLFDEKFERSQLEREVRAACSSGFAHAFRHQVSAILVRLSGWVKPAAGSGPVEESALIRLAR